jgi:hypothetical protein
MALVDSVVVFVVTLLIGALGIYVGARAITDVDDYTYAIVSALIASIVWVIVALLLGWIPFLGPLLALIAYLAVIKSRYPGGWLKAIAIALVAWLASLVVLYVLSAAGLTAFDAVGVPRRLKNWARSGVDQAYFFSTSTTTSSWPVRALR